MKCIKSLLVAASLLAATSFVWADQYVPLLSYRVGPYGSNGASFFGGLIDYMNLTNLNGGINGVKLSWEECETEYNASRGVECYERLKSKNGGLYDKIVNGHQFAKTGRKYSWPAQMKKESIDKLEVYWFETFNDKNKIIPTFIEGQILQKSRRRICIE